MLGTNVPLFSTLAASALAILRRRLSDRICGYIDRGAIKLLRLKHRHSPGDRIALKYDSRDMKNCIYLLIALGLFAACEQKETTVNPPAEKKESNTTVVNPPAQKKESNTTVINPSPATKEEKTDININTSPSP